MAELVDASVSNTDAARRAGSTPALGTIASVFQRLFLSIISLRYIDKMKNYFLTLFSIAALTKRTNRGCGSSTVLFNSG